MAIDRPLGEKKRLDLPETYSKQSSFMDSALQSVELVDKSEYSSFISI